MSYWQQNIYPHLPVFAQNCCISAYGYAWNRRRFGGIFKEEVKGYLDREEYSSDQWREFQTLQLRKILCHAFETVPFYRKRYSELGFTLSQFKRFELEDLSKLPFLTKEELRKFGTTSLVSVRKEKNSRFFSSSGSTGTPTRILYSHSFHQRCNAFMEARVRNWAGVTGQTPRGTIGGRRIIPDASNTPPFYRYNIFEKQTYFSAYHISQANARNYLSGIQDNRVEYMTGYAAANHLLASYLDDFGSVNVPQLKAVITSSEKLTSQMRTTFSKVYGCRTFDSYSGVENCGLISESPGGELLINPDVGIMEVLNDSFEPVLPGEEGEVVSTGFLNFNQPLIRYRIGDVVRLSENQNTKCGRSMKVVSEISGRTEDGITTEDGRKMVRFHGVFIDLNNVLKGQVIQHSYSSFSVNVITSNEFSQIEEDIIKTRMRSQLGDNVNVEVNRVSSIPNSSNGKFKAVISELEQ